MNGRRSKSNGLPHLPTHITRHGSRKGKVESRKRSAVKMRWRGEITEKEAPTPIYAIMACACLSVPPRHAKTQKDNAMPCHHSISYKPNLFIKKCLQTCLPGMLPVARHVPPLLYVCVQVTACERDTTALCREGRAHRQGMQAARRQCSRRREREIT